MIAPYEPFIEKEMKEFYDALPEDMKRKYAATEATKAGYGGTKYISDLLGCGQKTIYRGQQELESDCVKKTRNRREKRDKRGAEEKGSKQ